MRMLVRGGGRQAVAWVEIHDRIRYSCTAGPAQTAWRPLMPVHRQFAEGVGGCALEHAPTAATALHRLVSQVRADAYAQRQSVFRSRYGGAVRGAERPKPIIVDAWIL